MMSNEAVGVRLRATSLGRAWGGQKAGRRSHRSQFPVPRSRLSRHQSGFTLLGVLIAALFMVLVAGALASAAQHTGRAQRAAKDRFIATLLAREGIELVRAVRDGNWLHPENWNPPGSQQQCLQSSPPRCEVYWRGRGIAGYGTICDGVFRIDATTVTLEPPPAGAEGTRLYRRGIGYSHDAVGGEITRFRRWVEISTPPGEGGCGRSSVFVPFGQPGRRVQPEPFIVKVIVAWDDTLMSCASGGRCVELREDLYPWMNFR